MQKAVNTYTKHKHTLVCMLRWRVNNSQIAQTAFYLEIPTHVQKQTQFNDVGYMGVSSSRRITHAPSINEICLGFRTWMEDPRTMCLISRTCQWCLVWQHRLTQTPTRPGQGVFCMTVQLSGAYVCCNPATYTYIYITMLHQPQCIPQGRLLNDGDIQGDS